MYTLYTSIHCFQPAVSEVSRSRYMIQRLLRLTSTLRLRHPLSTSANTQHNEALDWQIDGHAHRCSKIVQRWSSLPTVARTLLESSLQYPSISFSAKLRSVLTFWCHGNTSAFNRWNQTLTRHITLSYFHVFVFHRQIFSFRHQIARLD